MKPKAIFSLAFLAVVLVIVGILLIGQGSKGKKTHTAEVEIAVPIDPTFNQEAIKILSNSDKAQPVQDFALPLDLQQGMGNTNPFNTAQ
jgi:hypothetical protein